MPLLGETGLYDTVERFIAGRWSPAANGEVSEVINPATEIAVGEVPIATPEDIDRALDAAENAYRVWRQTSAGG